MRLGKVLALGLAGNLLNTTVLALLSWGLWSACGLARYFPFLPVAWQTIPPLHMVGIFLLAKLVQSAWTGISIEARA
jgi:hypothetical protein